MNNGTSAFDEIWDKIILPSIRKCLDELDIQFKSKARVSGCNLTKYKKSLEDIYKRKREWLKVEYLPNEDDPILDFHKLSSIMCRSIIGVKHFTYDIKLAEEFFEQISNDENISQSEKVKWQIDNVYVNYKLAFLVAEGIVYVDLLFWAQERINDLLCQYNQEDIDSNKDNVSIKLKVYEEFIELLNTKQQRLYSYEVSDSHDNFTTSSIIALMKNDYLRRDFDYLQFAISMFQWQQYTKKQHLYDILKQYDDNLNLSDFVS